MPAEMNTQHKEVPPNNVLSDLDKAYTVLNYPLLNPDANAPQWSVEHALQVAGVTGSSREKILLFLRHGIPDMNRSAHMSGYMAVRTTLIFVLSISSLPLRLGFWYSRE